MKFVLTITDAPGKTIEANVNFEGGYDTHSDAHQVGRVILNYLDKIMEKGPVTLDVGATEIEGTPV